MEANVSCFVELAQLDEDLFLPNANEVVGR